MQFRIADSFTDSLSRLAAWEQTIVKTSVYDYQVNPAHPGLGMHKLSHTKDPNFWSIEANKDIRIIVHIKDSSHLICYTNHHDDAYAWTKSRKLEVHPQTGAAQLVEIRELVKEIPVYRPAGDDQVNVANEPPGERVFRYFSRDNILSVGVPEEWVNDIWNATELQLYNLLEHLPSEAQEALLQMAVEGTMPETKEQTIAVSNPFDHPDAQRRFFAIKNLDELKLALEYPWDKWAIFLHPAQRSWVSREFNGPSRVSGSAGTGKTIVALHRAVHLARKYTDARILLTTFSPILANFLSERLNKLVSMEPSLLDRIEVEPLHEVAEKLYKRNFGEFNLVEKPFLETLVKGNLPNHPQVKFNAGFVLDEWLEVVAAANLKDLDSYKAYKRLGRKVRLAETQRENLWGVFTVIQNKLDEIRALTNADLYHRLTNHYTDSGKFPFDYIVIDESQDISMPQLKLLGAGLSAKADGLFFAGDLGQQIFQKPFSWVACGVNVQGKARTLKVNYRTSQRIREQADKLLNPVTADADGVEQIRKGTVSVFEGVKPLIQKFSTREAERAYANQRISQWLENGIQPNEIGVFVRSEKEIPFAEEAMAKIPYSIMDINVRVLSNKVSLSTMHFAKGLEFKAVLVMACDGNIIPSFDRIRAVSNADELEEVYNSERHLLYVACTRARDILILTGQNPGSEFLEDMK